MLKRTLISLVLFYFLVLVQGSFLIHFSVFGFVPNFVLILVIVINLFASPKNWWGLASALIGGFFLDIFSASFLGFNLLILLAISLFLKMFLRKYVQVPAV